MTDSDIKGLDDGDNTQDFNDYLYIRATEDSPVYSIKKEYLMGTFLPGLSTSANSEFTLSKLNSVVSISDEILSVVVDFLNTRKGVDLFVTKKGEPFGHLRHQHDIMNPIYIGDEWEMSMKDYRQKKDMWLANLGVKLVPNPSEGYTLEDAFNYAEHVMYILEYLGINGLCHLASARLKFLVRNYHGKPDEFREFVKNARANTPYTR